MIFLEVLFLLTAFFLFIPVFVVTLQVILSLPAFRKKEPGNNQPIRPRPSIAVLVPAHNESAGIAETLSVISVQLQEGDRMLVVADNCIDDTADVAKINGAEVIERKDRQHRGKGYALDYGVRHLEHSPPDVLIIVDADCTIHADGLELLANRCISANRPVQALYLMFSPPDASLKTKISEFAWAVKNRARPLGYQRIGLPCQLMGTGMAFPWELIQQSDLASGHLVEDLKLGLDFAAAGYAPIFCNEALVTSVFPVGKGGLQSQRTRWEHGHLGMILKDGPPQLLRAMRMGNIRLLALVLDMAVPPLALLVLLVVSLSLFSVLPLWLTGSFFPWSLAWVNLLLLAIAVFLAWIAYGRGILSLGNLAYSPLYALAKVPLYFRFIAKRQVEWVRSRRDNG